MTRSLTRSDARVSDKHAAAVRRSLEWADEAAGRRRYDSALKWLAVVEAVGDELPGEYQGRRQAWLRALGNPR